MLKSSLIAGALTALMTLPAVANDLLSKPWEEIAAQAKEEGEVTWYVWYHLPGFRKITEAFTAETGIKVNIPDSASLDGILQKLISESGREQGDIDVIAMGGDRVNSIDLGATFTGPILGVLPESAALTDKINGGDGKGYTVAYWGNQTGIAYDSRRITEDELPQTVGELSAFMEANPYQLGFNFENGGSGPSFAQNVARNILGLTPDSKLDALPDLTPVWEWFNSREDQYTVTASNLDSLTRLNDGEFLIVPGWEDQLTLQIRDKVLGDHIKFYVPEFGMNGGGNMVGIPANAPNPAAALVFVDWLTSAETQTTFNAEFGTAPTNTDADSSKALVSEEQRKNTRDWVTPMSDREFMPLFIENVIQK